MRPSLSRIGKLVLGAFALGVTLAFCLDLFAVNLLGFASLDVPRNALAFAMLAMCAGLFTKWLRSDRPGIIVALLAMTQIYQVGLGWDLPLGPASIIRIFPYLAIGVVMAGEARECRTSQGEKTGLLAWIFVVVMAMVAGIPNGSFVIPAAIGLAVLPSLGYLFFKNRLETEPESTRASLMAGALVAFFVLGIGTLVLVRIGLGLNLGGGVGGLLSTRNISDFNLVLAYLVLLYPLAVIGAKEVGPLMVGLMSAVAMAACVIGLSRVGLFFIPVLTVCALATLYGKKPGSLLVALATTGLVGIGAYLAMPQRDLLGKVWLQRLNIGSFTDLNQMVSRVMPGGADSQDRDEIRQEALRLYQMEPLTGHGLGGFAQSSTVGFNDAHSFTFTMLAEWGPLGYGVVVILLLVAALRCLQLTDRRWRSPGSVLWIVALMMWILVVHTVGGQLGVWSEHSFTVNLMNGLLLVLYFFAGPIQGSASRPSEVAA